MTNAKSWFEPGVGRRVLYDSGAPRVGTVSFGGPVAGGLFLTSTGDRFLITSYGEWGNSGSFATHPGNLSQSVPARGAGRGDRVVGAPFLRGAALRVGGGDEDQIGEVLGIGERRAVRGQFPHPRPPMAKLMQELV